MMPGMDGYTICGILKTILRRPTSPCSSLREERTERHSARFRGRRARLYHETLQPARALRQDPDPSRIETLAPGPALVRGGTGAPQRGAQQGARTPGGDGADRPADGPRTAVTRSSGRFRAVALLTPWDLSRWRWRTSTTSSVQRHPRHEGGDVVLKSVADIFVASVRKEDMAARWGGEEFLLIFPGYD